MEMMMEVDGEGKGVMRGTDSEGVGDSEGGVKGGSDSEGGGEGGSILRI